MTSEREAWLARAAEQDCAEMSRARQFGSFLDMLARPTPAMLWLEAAAEQLLSAPSHAIRERNKSVIAATLRARDGDGCWYCAKSLGRDHTLEHLQPLSKGGSWDLDNLVLAHRRCNLMAADLGMVAKLKLRDLARSGGGI